MGQASGCRRSSNRSDSIYPRLHRSFSGTGPEIRSAGERHASKPKDLRMREIQNMELVFPHKCFQIERAGPLETRGGSPRRVSIVASIPADRNKSWKAWRKHAGHRPRESRTTTEAGPTLRVPREDRSLRSW